MVSSRIDIETVIHMAHKIRNTSQELMQILLYFYMKNELGEDYRVADTIKALKVENNEIIM
jgi:hypothetical protein